MKTARMIICLLTVVFVALFATTIFAQSSALPPEDPKAQMVEKQLDTVKVELTFTDKPVSEVFDFLQTTTKVTFVLDKNKVDTTKTVTIQVKDVLLRTAIERITEQLGLKYAVLNSAVLISDEEGARQHLVGSYKVVDLLKPKPGPGGKLVTNWTIDGLINYIKKSIEPGTWREFDDGKSNYIGGANGVLVICATSREVHYKVQALLDDLRHKGKVASR